MKVICSVQACHSLVSIQYIHNLHQYYLGLSLICRHNFGNNRDFSYFYVKASLDEEWKFNMRTGNGAGSARMTIVTVSSQF